MLESERIASAYNKIYGQAIDVNSEEDRIRMQKAIYLLNELGVACGDYPFIWYLHGPYSYALDVVVQNMKETEIQHLSSFDFNIRTNSAIEAVKKLLLPTDKGGYEIEYYWPETVGSLHYLMTYTMPHAKKKEIIDYLQVAKPHLNNAELNSIAYDRIRNTFMMNE